MYTLVCISISFNQEKHEALNQNTVELEAQSIVKAEGWSCRT